MEIHALSDPARFAGAIRALARDAHRTLAHSPSAGSLRRLSRRIELLASALGDRREGPLGTWLDNLGREVKSAAVQRAGSSRPRCLCASMNPRSGGMAGTPYRAVRVAPRR